MTSAIEMPLSLFKGRQILIVFLLGARGGGFFWPLLFLMGMGGRRCAPESKY